MTSNTFDLEAMLKRIRGLLSEYREAAEPLFKCLCQLADHWNLDAEVFRGLLVREGLRPERASEIKAVLLSPSARHKFLAKNQTWNDSLAEAQQRPPQPHRAAARLIRLLVKWGATVKQGNLDRDWSFRRDSEGNFEFQGPPGTLQVVKVAFPAAKSKPN